MAPDRIVRSPVDLLLVAIEHVETVPGREPWQRGWCDASYRRSPRAALPSPLGPVTIAGPGLEAYEQAVEGLLREPAIKERWGTEELWGIVASIVVTAASGDGPGELQRDLKKLREASETLVVLEIANVRWDCAPLRLADVVVGTADTEWLSAVNGLVPRSSLVDGRLLGQILGRYADAGVSRAATPVVVAILCRAQHQLAITQGMRRLRLVLDIALLLEPTPERLEMYSLRGTTNRPGVRGIELDRPAITAALQNTDAARELAAEIICLGDHGGGHTTHWHAADPVPLDRLLEHDERVEALAACLNSASPVARRLGVAARWYAEGHWADELDYAALALGVALDALIGARAGLPGRAMRERYALLEPETSQREGRARRYQELSSVRSSVAHGGRSRALEDADFVRGMARDVVWAAHRMLALQEAFGPASDEDVDAAFEALRWGTNNWE